MKKNFTRVVSIALCLTLMIGSKLSAQVVYSEDFQSVVISPTPPLVGPLPAGIVQYNVDGHTPNAAVSFMGTNAWVVRNIVGSKALTSNSWYNPISTSDDWLVLPAITMPASGNANLKYRCFSQDPAYLENYEIWVTTTGNTVADFTTNGTMVFTEEAPPFPWNFRLLDFTAYLGQTIYIAFRDTSDDKYLLNLDDIAVGILPANDVTLTNLNLPLYQTTSVSDSLYVSFYNIGIDTVTSLTVDWNDGVSHIGNITGLNIPPYGYGQITHPIAVTYPTVGEYNIITTITAVNGGADENPGDNQDSILYHTLSSVPQHNVLYEELVGVGYDRSPQGVVTMDYLETTYPLQAICISVHFEDTMTVTDYADQSYAWGAPPLINADRYYWGQQDTVTLVEEVWGYLQPTLSPASLTISNTWNYATREIVATVTTHFLTDFSAANFAVGLIVVENGVTNTHSSFDQTNAFAGGGLGVMGGFELLPNPVPAAQMVYDRVARAMLGGFNGQPGSIPTTVIDLQNVDYVFNYILPAEYDESNIRLVAVLIDQEHGTNPGTGAVAGWCVNAAQIDMNFNIGIDEPSNVQMNLYPNPASDMTNVQLDLIKAEDINLYVYDMAGKQLYEHKYGILLGTQYLTIPLSELAKGKYIVSVTTPTKSYSKQLLVK